MGVTVRDITYEVRRYFQMKPDESGVIISKIERGSRASVAGLKPMETIRSVNDKPITSVKEFENAIKAGGEFKLAIKRMTQGRTVKVKCEPAGTGPSKSEGAKKGGDMDQNDDPGGNP
jgi:S1-C subfamily serine protease